MVSGAINPDPNWITRGIRGNQQRLAEYPCSYHHPPHPAGNITSEAPPQNQFNFTTKSGEMESISREKIEAAKALSPNKFMDKFNMNTPTFRRLLHFIGHKNWFNYQNNQNLPTTVQRCGKRFSKAQIIDYAEGNLYIFQIAQDLGISVDVFIVISRELLGMTIHEFRMSAKDPQEKKRGYSDLAKADSHHSVAVLESDSGIQTGIPSAKYQRSGSAIPTPLSISTASVRSRPESLSAGSLLSPLVSQSIYQGPATSMNPETLSTFGMPEYSQNNGTVKPYPVTLQRPAIPTSLYPMDNSESADRPEDTNPNHQRPVMLGREGAFHRTPPRPTRPALAPASSHFTSFETDGSHQAVSGVTNLSDPLSNGASHNNADSYTDYWVNYFLRPNSPQDATGDFNTGHGGISTDAQVSDLPGAPGFGALQSNVVPHESTHIGPSHIGSSGIGGSHQPASNTSNVTTNTQPAYQFSITQEQFDAIWEEELR